MKNSPFYGFSAKILPAFFYPGLILTYVIRAGAEPGHENPQIKQQQWHFAKFYPMHLKR